MYVAIISNLRGDWVTSVTAGEDNYAANYLNGQEYDGGAKNLELEQPASTKVSDSKDYDTLDNSRKQKVEKVKKDKKLVESVETYFSERSTVFDKANKKDKDSTLKTKVRAKKNINKKIKDNSINRIEKIREVEEKSKLEFTKGEVESEIRDVTYEPNGEVVLNVYEWTWVEYNDGKDKFGYGTDHEVTLEETDDSYNIISDEYDETDIWDHQTEDYEKSSLYSEEKELHSDIESDISQLSSEFEPLSQTSSINNLATQPVAYSATSLADRLSDYNVGKAIDYADKWVYIGEPSDTFMKTEFYNLNEFGYQQKDCCNYVSQCLYKGGISYENGATRNASSGSQWWFDTNAADKTENIYACSITWRKVYYFESYWKNEGVTSLTATSSNCYPGNPVYYIDPSSDDHNGHIWICTGYDTAGNPIFNAHNRDVYHIPFSFVKGNNVPTRKTLMFNNGNVTINKPSSPSNTGFVSSSSGVTWNSILTPKVFQYFKFSVYSPRTYYIYTTGSIDTVGTLYKEVEYTYNGQKFKTLEEVARDDDGGDSTNFRISETLYSNVNYYIKVRGYNYQTGGAYSLKVTYNP